MRHWLQQFLFFCKSNISRSTSSFSDFVTAPMLRPTLHTVYHVSRIICRIFLALKIRFWFLCGDHLLHVTPTPNMNSTVTPPVQCCTDTIKLYICFFFFCYILSYRIQPWHQTRNKMRTKPLHVIKASVSINLPLLTIFDFFFFKELWTLCSLLRTTLWLVWTIQRFITFNPNNQLDT